MRRMFHHGNGVIPVTERPDVPGYDGLSDLPSAPSSVCVWQRLMLYKTLSAAVYGIDANIIEVEVDVSGVRMNEDHFHTVGLPDAAVRESRDRVALGAEELRLRYSSHPDHHQSGAS